MVDASLTMPRHRRIDPVRVAAGRHRRVGRHRRQLSAGAATTAAAGNVISSALIVGLPAYSIWWLAHN